MYLLKKKGGSGVFWVGKARSEHPTPYFIETTHYDNISSCNPVQAG
jgi:hypothetical protein